tara:strand:+ start:530 stop:907 length:378 start_codon:yes stop_codon:yes gene_type:complete
MGDIFLNDHNINYRQLDENLIRYNQKIYTYSKLIMTHKIQLENYRKLLKEIKTQIYKEKIVLNNYKKHVDDIDKYICKICYEKYCDCVISPCMHFTCCLECVEKITDKKCPYCREEFKEYLKLFY